MPVPNVTPLPRTAAGLSAALREFMADPEQYRGVVQYLAGLVDWLRRREPGQTVVLPVKKPVPAKSSTPVPAGATAYFDRYLAVVSNLEVLVAVLEAALVQREVAATPLYRTQFLGGARPPSAYEPAQDRYLIDDKWSDVVDLETDRVIALADRADYWELYPVGVPWWPAVPPALAAQGFDATTCPTDELVIGEVVSGRATAMYVPPAWSVLPDYAQTMALLAGHAAAYTDLGKSLNQLQTPEAGRARRAMHSSAAAFRAYFDAFTPIADQMAGELAQFLDEADAALVTLANLPTTPGDTPMPQLSTATPANVATLAGQIRDSITSGHGGRIAVSPDAEIAFSWSPGVATTLLRYLALGTAAGRKTTVVIAADSGTPLGSVAEGGTKPNAVSFASKEVDLLKYAGLASLSVESSQFIANIEAAVTNVMGTRILRGIEADTVATILAGAGVTVAAAADMTAGVLEAIAAIRGNGGTATVVGLSAADWIATMTATGSSGYLNFSNPEAGPAGTWLGLFPVILPTLVDGSALVLDGTAVTVLETDGGPLCVVDPFTGLSTNQIRIAIETWATSVVNAPGGVATVGVTPAAERTAAKR